MGMLCGSKYIFINYNVKFLRAKEDLMTINIKQHKLIIIIANFQT